MTRPTLRKILALALVGIPLLCMSAVADVAPEAAKKFILVLDAGHGGHDAGAVGAYSKEKDINLKVTLEVGRLVKANCPDVKIVYTRSTDVFVPLQTRADIANRNKADLFVSVHTNSLPKGRIAYGSETYTLGMARAAANLEVAKRENSVITYEKNYKETYEGFDPNRAESYIIFELMQDRYMKQSVDLARSIQQQYVSAGRKNKGVHQAGFLVLRKTSMPAVLTELGFISTPEEETYLNSAAGVSALARSIYNGIVTYRSQYDKNATAKAALVLPAPIDEGEPDKPSDVAVVPVDAGEKPSKEKAKGEVRKEEKAETAVKDSPKTEAKKESGEGSSNEKAGTADDSRPVFKVQLFVADRRLAANDRRLKGLNDADFYSDGGSYKYTYGSTNDYTEAKSIQKSIADKFPDTFIVAFRGAERINLAEAIREAKKE